MAYIDTSKVTIPKGFFNDLNVPKLFEWLNSQPTADVVPRAECEKWYHEYHVLKDELSLEKRNHRATESLADRYCAELQMKKAELDALIKNYAECMKDYATEIFAELDTFVKLLCTDNDDILIYSEIKKKYEGSDT